MGAIWHVLFLFGTVFGSPFELTDRYVDDFAHGIENLKKLSKEYVFEEGHFDPNDYNETEALKNSEEYDFIIVGAGTSGSVIANRLSEVPEWKILVLEAGDVETPYTQVPKLYGHLSTTPYSWGYKTEKQETWCLGMVDHRCSIPTGRALGGTSSINGMLYTRGNQKDYDRWADAGNDGWCFNDVLPYFKKSENAHLHHFDHNYHSQGGPLNVEEPQFDTVLTEKFKEAAHESGLKYVDYNGKEQLGFGRSQVTTKNGRRHSTAQGYLVPAKSRKNLVVKPLSHVVKILISPHTKEAQGVKYIHGGHLHVAKAHKEIILAAGTINTPQLLMLSGVGPKEHLQKLSIEPLVDLKVGHNLKDHIGFIGVNFLLNDTITEKHNEHEILVEYLRNGKGPLSSNDLDSIAYIKTEASKDKMAYPDIELIFTPKSPNEGYDSIRSFSIAKETYDSIWKPVEHHKSFSIWVMQTSPKSRGVVELKSADPLKHPSITLPQLSDDADHDINTMLKGVRKAVEIGKSEVFQHIGATINHNQVLGCQEHEFDTDDYWKCAVRHLSISLGHLSGTAKMGPETDKDAVVDNKLNVHGVHKLRVADASIIPGSLAGHYHAPVVMIGEKAADVIKEHWK